MQELQVFLSLYFDKRYQADDTRIVLNQKKIIGKVLDYGCGIGKDVELLKNKGIDIAGYDPFYFQLGFLLLRT